jgi:putative inorganic carbon (hco3(-)) transporter
MQIADKTYKLIHTWIQKLKHLFLIKKLQTPAGLALLGLISVGIGAAAFFNYKWPLLITIALAAGFFVYVAVTHPSFGFIATFILSALILLPERLFFTTLPWPAAIEGLTYVVVIGVVAQQYRQRLSTQQFWRSPLTIAFIVLLLYYCLDLVNPIPHNKAGVTNFIRKQLGLFLFFYASYFTLHTYQAIVRFMKIWLFIVMGIALYGIKQQWIGLTENEMNWLVMVPMRFELFYQAGFIRKFSILNDPASYGTLCASSAILTLVIAIRSNWMKTRILFYACSIILAVASTYSGTRTCNLMIVAGIAAYALFTLTDKRTYILIAAATCFSLFMLFGPFRHNPVVFRIKSTFEGTKDASALLRDYNRHQVQPYLQDHPMGGGIGTCGLEGAIYNPTHYLTNFQPDSGYMKIFAEQGWIGLLLQLIFYGILLIRGIYGYFHSQNPTIKTWYIAITTCLFTLMVGQYSQIAIGPYPQILFYIGSLIVLYKLEMYDHHHVEENNSNTVLNPL